MIRRKLSGLLVFTMVISLLINGSIFAVTSPTSAETTKVEPIIISEYEAIKILKSKTEIELKNIGLKDEEISKLRNFNFAEELKKRSNLDKETLVNKGYNDDQISMLQSFQGTETEMISLSAGLSLLPKMERFAYVSYDDYTYCDISYNWSWSSEPLFMGTDLIAVGWSGGMLFHTGNPYSYSRINYKSVVTGILRSSQYSFTNVGIGTNAQSTFKVGLTTEWAESGNGWIQIKKAGYNLECQATIAYGHSTYSITSPSISYPWGISFGLSSGVLKLDPKEMYGRIY